MADIPVPPAPATRRGDDADLLHGVEVHDPYRWLEDGSSAEVAAWVAAHNHRTREALDARPVRARWHERLAALTGLPTTLSVRVAGDRLFTLERPAGADQYVLCLRSATDAAAPPTVLVDPAAMAADAAVAIDWFHPSADGGLVAYGLSEGGTENSLLHVLDVRTGEVLADRIPDTRAASVAWLPDATGFWYACYPPGDEYHRHIRFHVLGTPAADDVVVFDRRPTPEAWPDVSVSRDGRFVVVHQMAGWTRVDVHVLDRATGEWTDVVAGIEAQSSFHVHDGVLVGVTTRDAANGRVVRIAIDQPDQWHTLVAERADSVLGASAVAGDDLLVVASTVAVDRLERYPLGLGLGLGGGESSPCTGTVDLGVASVVSLDADTVAATGSGTDAAAVFVARGTFGAPIDLWRVVPGTDGGSMLPWGDAADATVLPDIAVRQLMYPSLDGTMIPMFVAHRSDVQPSATTPLILTGYGGFAIAESPVWMPNLAAWCAEGGVYCVAGLRGGYEYGDAWHRAGRRANKQHVFDDFHAAADWLVDEGFTSRHLLALHGGSNGGLLMGAAITQRPDLAAAVWCAVPLLDMIRFPQFLIARLWTDEYGDPDVAEEFGWLHAYSPYHRVRHGERYPAVLFTTAEGDTRVDPCHARKMAARMIEAAADQHVRPVLLWQAGRAGHGVGKPASMRVAEGADVLSFFSWHLGLDG
ncbi:MAG: prolyl oligopeptidase family serine peptidase [Ilumatobacteraceae bacterium]